MLLLAGGGVGVLAALEWSVVLGCTFSVIAIAVQAAREPRAEEAPVTIRGPVTYAGPGLARGHGVGAEEVGESRWRPGSRSVL